MASKLNAKCDWGLLVVLVAVELNKRDLDTVTGDMMPASIQLPLVQSCSTCRPQAATSSSKII